MALTDNLLAYWKLDETSGNASDSVGTNTLTNNNSATFTDCVINNGIALNGSSQSFTFGSTFSPGTGDFSISLWFYKTGGSTYPQLLSKWNEDTNQRSFVIAIFGAPSVYFYTSSDGSNGASQMKALASTTTISNNTWYHLVVTKTGGTVKIYINGELDATSTDFQTAVYTSSIATTLGYGIKFAGSSNQYFGGNIDELAIWSRVLIADEVEELYNSGSGLTYPFADAPKSITF